MEAPIVSVTNSYNQPISATNIGSGKKVEAGHFVVNPAKNIYKYSMFDELHLEKDFTKELMKKYSSKELKRQVQTRNARNTIKKLVKLGVVIVLGVLAFKNREALKTNLTKFFDAVKNLFKK